MFLTLFKLWQFLLMRYLFRYNILSNIHIRPKLGLGRVIASEISSHLWTQFIDEYISIYTVLRNSRRLWHLYLQKSNIGYLFSIHWSRMTNFTSQFEGFQIFLLSFQQETGCYFNHLKSEDYFPRQGTLDTGLHILKWKRRLLGGWM